jgi:phosphoglycerate kinase
MSFKTLSDFDYSGKYVLLRTDLNVPVKEGEVTDTTRIDRVKPTIDYLVERGAKILVLAHFGRPKGEALPEYSLNFLPEILERQWGYPVHFSMDCVGDQPERMKEKMKNGDILLLENIRFKKGEEKNDPAFTKELALLGDYFVNDAFSAAHRAHASIEGLANLMHSAPGLLMEAEINALTNALDAPKRPVMAIVGGAKISTKLSVLNNLAKKVDYMVLGGGMASTFLYAQGFEVGLSLCEKDMKDEALKILNTAKEENCEIILPIDRITVKEFGEHAPHEVTPSNAMPADREAVDIGPESVKNLADIMEQCKTVLWNGPMGVFEVKPFDNGTNALADKVAELTKSGKIISVAGGGDTVAALENAGCAHEFTYISTAGGAFLEWLEGKELPGVAALS